MPLWAVAGCLRDSVCITTADLEAGPTIVYVNAAFSRLTGYLPSEVIGKTPRILHGPKTQRAELDRLKRELRQGLGFQGEAINYRRDGSEFVMAWYVAPLRDGDGRVTHYLGVQRDATDARANDTAGLLFVAAINQTTDGIMAVDTSSKVLHVNPACVAMVGAPPEEILGRPARETGLAPRRLRVYRDILRALAEEGEWQGEYETSARRGEPRRLAVTITRVSTTEPEPRFVVDARDVTHQRRLEYIADAANLVENVGYVFAGLRHELGNPVNSIKTALTVVRQTLWTLPPDRVEDYLDRVLQEVARVEYLLRSLQSFNATHRPVLEPVAIGPFLARFAAIIRSDVERRGVSLMRDVEEGAGAVIADPRALHQVLLNLLSNALDALEGRVDSRIRIGVRRRGAHVLILVADNGPGIALERRGHIFKPFHTSKQKGTGLGLAITRKLVTLMHGTIEVDPPGGGETVFTVTLDAADAPDSTRRSGTVRPPRGAS